MDFDVNLGSETSQNIYEKLLDARDFGSPQSRQRWFCVGIKESIMKEGAKFKFPQRQRRVKLGSIIDYKLPADDTNTYSEDRKMLVDRIHKEYQEQLVDVVHKDEDVCAVIYLDKKFSWGRDISPCIIILQLFEILVIKVLICIGETFCASSSIT